MIDGEKSGYFLQVSSYIHLNPVRAGLVRTDYPLRSYRWSSFPLYLMPAGKRERWLWVGRVLDELGGHQDNRRGRQSYEVYIEGLAKRIRDKKELKSFDEKWGPIRRGWYLGGEDFKDRLLDMVDKVRDGKEKDTYYGDEVRAHDEAQAEKLLQVGLGVLKLKEHDLKKMAKGVKEKQVLAWWLRKKTMTSRKWISQRLGMGDVSRITQAVSLLNRNEDMSIVRLKKQLEGIS